MFKATRPTLPSSNRTCGFPASGSPENSRLRHAQAVSRVVYKYTSPMLKCWYHVTPFGGRKGRWLRRCKMLPIRRPRTYQSISQCAPVDTQWRSSSPTLSGADSALQSVWDRLEALVTTASSRAASPAPAGPPSSTETDSGTSGRALSDRDHTETCIPESPGSPLLPSDPPPASFPG